MIGKYQLGIGDSWVAFRIKQFSQSLVIYSKYNIIICINYGRVIKLFIIVHVIFQGVFRCRNKFGGGVHMEGLNFLVTSICFSVLGYVLCFLTLSSNNKLKTPDDTQKNHWQDENAA